MGAPRDAHSRSAGDFARGGYRPGIPVIAPPTLAGTSVFATPRQGPGPRLQIAVGLAGVLAAILAGLRTFLGYPGRAEDHRVAGAK